MLLYLWRRKSTWYLAVLFKFNNERIVHQPRSVYFIVGNSEFNFWNFSYEVRAFYVINERKNNLCFIEHTISSKRVYYSFYFIPVQLEIIFKFNGVMAQNHDFLISVRTNKVDVNFDCDIFGIFGQQLNHWKTVKSQPHDDIFFLKTNFNCSRYFS